MNFRDYLQRKGFAESSIVNHELNLARFKYWCKTGNHNLKEITYQELLKYPKYLLDTGIRKATINNYINSLKKYYDYLIELKITGTNPAKAINIRNKEREVLQDILSFEDLENIYTVFLNKPKNKRNNSWKLRHNRNVVILGLMIYQGLDIGGIRNLEPSHLKLEEGKIYIPSSKRSNSRILKLDAKQIFPLITYVNQTRNELLKIEKAETDKLFFGKSNLLVINDSIIEQLRKKFPVVRNLGQIRSSVIMNWLNNNNIRQVQYMAGHKYISSTERYKKEDLKDLQRQLELFHPLK